MSEILTPEVSARLRARFAVVRGRTRMVECRSDAPLKIAKPFEMLDGGLEVCVMDASPGLLDGDSYDFDWQLDEGAKVRLTTQGFARVHPSRGRGASQQVRISLAEGAHLELVPQPLLLFAEAALKLKMDAELAPSATLLGGELIGAGRLAHGEAFAFQSYESHTRICREGTPMYIARNATQPQDRDPRRLGAWGNFTHRGSVWAFRPSINNGSCEQWREVLNVGMQQFHSDKSAPAVETSLWGGVSTLERGGIIASLLGHNAWELQEAARQLHHCIQQS